MFKNLPTSLKLIILCSTFLVAISVTIYSLVAEKQIAIDFARKERSGRRMKSSRPCRPPEPMPTACCKPGRLGKR